MADQMKQLIPMETRLAAIGSVDIEARTAEVVWSTGAQIKRRDQWTGQRLLEELSLDPKHVDLSRLNNSAPLLNSHNAGGLSGIIGVVEPGTATVHNGKAHATIRFSKRADVEPIFRDVQDKIIRNVSVGYSVHKYEVREKEGEMPLYRAVDWQPMELSLVTVGADAGASVRAQDTRSFECEFVRASESSGDFQSAVAGDQLRSSKMPEDQPAATPDTEVAQPQPKPVPSVPAPPAPSLPVEPVAASALAERARIADIRKLRMDDAWSQGYIDAGTSIDKVREAYCAARVAEYEATATRGPVASITLGVDPRDQRVAAMTEMLLHRSNKAAFKLTDRAAQWAGLTLLETARRALEDQSIDTRGKDPMTLAGMAMGNVPLTRAGMHTTSDFLNALLAVPAKLLRAGYERAPRTFLTVFNEGSLPDFRPAYRVQLGDMDAFEKVNEHGEFKYGTFGDSKETLQLATYGKIFAFTRQLLINDDINMLSRLPALFGYKAADLESDIVWGVVTSNPVMSDGNAYFSAAHSNLAAAGAAPSVTTLGAARAAMRAQRASTLGSFLNIQASYMVIPTTLETSVDQLLSPITPAVTTNTIPAFVRSLTVVVEPRLDVNSTTAWYLFANPGSIDTIEYDYLNGQSGVQTETREGFTIDGTEMRARIDFGAAAIDWRGAYKNPGV